MAKSTFPAESVELLLTSNLHRMEQVVGPHTIEAAVSEGLDFDALAALRSAFGISGAELALILNVSYRTLSRLGGQSPLPAAVSDRAIRLLQVYSRAYELHLRDLGATRNWFRRPWPALEGKTPLSLLSTEVGTSLVDSLIGRQENGVFS